MILNHKEKTANHLVLLGAQTFIGTLILGLLIGLKQCGCGWKQIHINERRWGSPDCQDLKKGTWEKTGWLPQ